MAEPTIICPKCKNEIKLTESLAAPLIESTRREYEQRLAQKDLDLAGREKSLRDGEAALAAERRALAIEVRLIRQRDLDRRDDPHLERDRVDAEVVADLSLDLHEAVGRLRRLVGRVLRLVVR